VGFGINCGKVIVAIPLCFSTLLFTPTAPAQSQQKGDASLRVEYQYIATGSFFDALYEFDYANTDTHAAILSGNYAVADRWTLYASLPYIQKRHQWHPDDPYKGDPHNPNDPFWVDFKPPDLRFIDDGNYHGGFQDLSFGVQYLALDGPLSISPFVGYGWPTTNYPIYGKAAIGLNLWNIPVGANFSVLPYFSDWYLQGSVAYVFSEKPLDVNVDYLLAYLSTGYYFTPAFSMNVFATLKYVFKGLKMPYDFTDDPTYGNYPEAFDTPYWWQHDRLVGHRFANMGVGFDWFLNEKYQLSGTWFTGIWAEQSNEVDRAFTLALTRYWGSGEQRRDGN